MKKDHVVRWIIAVVYLSVQAAPAAQVSVLLEQGIYTEETVGDRAKAIEIYQQIVEDEQAGRKYVAEALFRLGSCYVEEGRDAEALAALEKLISQYADQEELVERAGTVIKQLSPDPLFPELDGCRLVYTVTFHLKDSPKPYNGGKFSFYQTDKVALRSEVDAALEERIDRLEFLKIPIREGQEQVAYPVQHFPGTTRFVPAQGMEWEDPGLYRCKVTGFRGEEIVTRYECLLEIKPAMYSQLGTNEIQSDGTIRFTSISQKPDMMRRTDSDSFINSDFVHIESMFDECGEEVEFTETHNNNHYRYHVTLNQPVHEGETLFLADRGWIENRLIKKVSGSESTYTYRMNHTPGTKEPTRRIKTYRLPAGAELVSTEPADLPHRVMDDGRVEILVDAVIPTGGSLLTAFSYRLGGEGESAQALKLQPAPWQDGEVLSYRLLTKSGMEVGRQVWTARSVRKDEKACWELEQRLAVPINNTVMYSRVVAEKADFIPLTGLTKHKLGEGRAVYSPGTIMLKTGGSEREINVDGTVYDNEQALYLIRRLPLAENYHGSFPIMSVLAGAAGMEVQVRVMDRETISVPAGDMDCWKVDLAVYMGSVKAVNQLFWFSVDGKVPVRIQTNEIDIELVDTEDKKELPLKDGDAALTLPGDWLGYELPVQGTGSEIVRLLPPEMRLEGMLCKTVRQPASLTLSEIAEKDIGMLKGYFKGYAVRENTVADREVNGLPVRCFAADYEEHGIGRMEYRAYMASGARIYWFVFRMDPDQFAAERAMLDRVIEGLKVNRE